ncbi:thioesterase family protein [Amycolatopsis sp.]|uniref:acyl-CoA thioesterase n=1 Tax=Amycolatopsis sp. TaxID=37632 RepID=UPI002C0C9D03|nr:thioesterase family protein [Amycolatopsis sp.]HVV10648.1 thioesterase family protein [Amycolatopsis sp.]
MAKTIARAPIRVRYHECDQQGIVFNAHYLAYFDMGSLEFFREVFGSYENLRARGVDTVVAASELTYRAPSRYDDELVVEVGIEHLGRTSLILAFTIVRGDELVTTGTNRYVFVDTGNLAKTAPPDDVREKLAALL